MKTGHRLALEQRAKKICQTKQNSNLKKYLTEIQLMELRQPSVVSIFNKIPRLTLCMLGRFSDFSVQNCGSRQGPCTDFEGSWRKTSLPRIAPLLDGYPYIPGEDVDPKHCTFLRTDTNPCAVVNGCKNLYCFACSRKQFPPNDSPTSLCLY